MNTAENRFKLFLSIGVVVSVSANLLTLGLTFTSILTWLFSYSWSKNKITSKRVIKFNEFFQRTFMSITVFFTLVLILKLLIYMLLENIWGIVLFDYGNNIFKAVMIGLSLVGLTTAFINIYNCHKIKHI